MRALPRLHQNELVNQGCEGIIDAALEVLWSHWPKEHTLAVLLCGSWPLEMGCARVSNRNVTFLSDFDFMAIIDDNSDLPSTHDVWLTMDASLEEKLKEREIDAKVDFSFIRSSSLPAKAEKLFWFDSCLNAIMIWGRSNPLQQIECPSRLSAQEGIELLTNRALGQLFILPQLFHHADDEQRILYHCGKVALDGVKALRIITGKYVPEARGVYVAADGVRVGSRLSSSLKDLIEAASFWSDQKKDYDKWNILSKFGSSEHGGEPSLFGVWRWAAQTFHHVWQIAMDIMLHSTDMEKTTKEVLIQRPNEGPIASCRSWFSFLSHSSQHRVRASIPDRLRFSWRATPIASARLCGVIALSWHPWGNSKDFRKGIRFVERFLPSTGALGFNYLGKWVQLLDDAVSIWRFHVNSYDERGFTLRECADEIDRYLESNIGSKIPKSAPK